MISIVDDYKAINERLVELENPLREVPQLPPFQLPPLLIETELVVDWNIQNIKYREFIPPPPPNRPQTDFANQMEMYRQALNAIIAVPNPYTQAKEIVAAAVLNNSTTREDFYRPQWMRRP